MNKKALSLLIVAVMLLSIAPAVSYWAPVMASTESVSGNTEITSVSHASNIKVKPLKIDMDSVITKIYSESLKTHKNTVRLIVVPQKGMEKDVLEALSKLGKIDPISKPEFQFIVVDVPVRNVPKLKDVPGILKVWRDRIVKLPPTPEAKLMEYIFKYHQLPPQVEPKNIGSSPYPSLYDWDMEVINAPEARQLYGVDGSGVKVAVIDTGADPGQPFLQTTPEGNRKIILWHDWTGEGLANLSLNFTSSDIVNGEVNITLSNVVIDWGAYSESLVRDPISRDWVGRPSEFTTLSTVNLTIKIPSTITSANGVYKFGFLPERYFDLNFDNNIDEVYFVLAVNSTGNGYDTVYLYPVPLQLNTTNASLEPVVQYLLNARAARNMGDYAGYFGNYTLAVSAFVQALNAVPTSGASYNFTIDLSQAVQMEPFEVRGDWTPLAAPQYTPYVVGLEVGYLVLRSVAMPQTDVVLSMLDSSGNAAVFGWDGGEHGTHVSGTIAGYGDPNPSYPWPFNETGMIGVAPGAQLMEYRALSSIGYGSDSWIIASMIDAAIDGADVISMSLGGNYDYNDGTESPENFFVDLLTEMFNVTFVIAAGNEGPGMNTVGSPGDSRFAITVGAYVDPEAWKWFAYGDSNVPPQVTDFSSRGPRMDGLLDPDVIAPGQFVFSTLPVYSWGQYGSWASDWWAGTSMATPHVSGVVALMLSYAKEHSFNVDPFKVKKALELSAKRIEGYNYDEQGFGLVQADKAIEELNKIAGTKTIRLYAGVPYTDLRTQIGDPWIPNKWGGEYINYVYGFPYLYGGIYIRNNEVSTVPVYVYSMNYNGTLKVESEAGWAIPSTDSIYVNTTEQAVFYVTVDYSQIPNPGIYTTIVQLIDPSTGIPVDYVPVTVFVPEQGENGRIVIHDVYQDIGDTVHRYIIHVPNGASEMVVNISTDSGNFLVMQLVPPTGTQILNWLGYGAFGLRNRVIHISNPTPGNWELIIWDWGEYSTGWTMHSNITVTFKGVYSQPELLHIAAKAGEGSVSKVTLRNELATFNATVNATSNVTLLLGNLWNTSGLIWGYQYEFYIDSFLNPEIFEDAVYLEAIVLSSDPTQNVYVEAGYGFNTDYPTILLTAGGTIQIPLVNNSLPAYLYVGSDEPASVLLLVIYKNDSVKVFKPGVNSITPFTEGSSVDIPVKVNASDNGTYLGALYLTDDYGNVVSVTPLAAEVGRPGLLVLMSGDLVLGMESKVRAWVLDASNFTKKVPYAELTINGKKYIARDGMLEFTVIPTSFTMEFDVKATAWGYSPYSAKFKLPVQEPVKSTITRADAAKAFLAGSGSLVTKKPKVTMVEFNDGYMGAVYKLTADGPTGEMGYVLLALPTNAKIYQFKRDQHVIKYWVLKGNKATYLLALVEYASPVTFTVTIKLEPTKVQPDFNVFNYLYNRWYQNKLSEFNKLYQKALDANVDETILQKALTANQTASEYYQKALDLAGGNIFLHLGDFRLLALLRNAYVAESTAVKILKEALGE